MSLPRALTKLQAMRDADVNALNDLFKRSGNAEQRALLDQYASSQSQARNLSQTLCACARRRVARHDRRRARQGRVYADVDPTYAR